MLDGSLKVDVLDPTLANGLVTPTMPGINWIPIKPTTNGALYAAIVQIMMRDKTYNADVLSFPQQKAAEAAGYGAFTNASYLVITDESHPNYRKLMRAEDAGIDMPEEKTADGMTVQHYVVIDAETNEAAAHTACDKAVFDYEGEVNGVQVRTGFAIMGNTVNAHTLEEYAEITGVPVAEIERMAKEYTSHGVKVSVNAGAGSTAGVNGFDTPNGREVLRALVGSNQMSGGSFPSGMPNVEGKGAARYDLTTVKGQPDVTTKNATILSRGGKAWEKTDEYKNRVAKGEKDPKPMLQWFATGTQSDSQALMSAVNQYPYQCKIMMTWMCNVIQGTPGAMRDEVVERLKDPEVLPLHIVCDVVIGEMAQVADYIVPDVTQYESFGIPSGGGDYGAEVRWQAKTPETPELEDGSYLCWETLLIDVAKACELPGWGEDAIPDAEGGMHPFDNVADYYLKAVANLAYADTPVADIDEAEMKLQGLDELPRNFKAAVSDEEWPKVLNVLSRGGRTWPDEYIRGADGRYKFLKPFETYIYNEKRALMTNCYSGKRLPPTLNYNPPMFSDLSLMTDHYAVEEFPFTNSEHKPRFRSISMLSNSPIMRDICAHNYLEINKEDAAALGIKDGDTVRAVTPLGDVSEGEAMVRGGQVQGAFSVSFGYGHSNYGAQDIDVDGQVTKGNPAIAAGVRTHQMLDPLVSVDGVLGILSDHDASSPGRCGSMFKIEKA